MSVFWRMQLLVITCIGTVHWIFASSVVQLTLFNFPTILNGSAGFFGWLSPRLIPLVEFLLFTSELMWSTNYRIYLSLIKFLPFDCFYISLFSYLEENNNWKPSFFLYQMIKAKLKADESLSIFCFSYRYPIRNFMGFFRGV